MALYQLSYPDMRAAERTRTPSVRSKNPEPVQSGADGIVSRGGLEPPTPALGVRRSVQLSYREIGGAGGTRTLDPLGKNQLPLPLSYRPLLRRFHAALYWRLTGAHFSH